MREPDVDDVAYRKIMVITSANLVEGRSEDNDDDALRGPHSSHNSEFGSLDPSPCSGSHLCQVRQPMDAVGQN